MSTSLLTINTVIPAPDRPSTPHIVCYLNGDWEIAFSGDVNYIADIDGRYLSSTAFVDFYAGLLEFYGLGDAEDVVAEDGKVELSLSESVIPLSEEEPVLMIWRDGVSEVMTRWEAENILKVDSELAYNFVTALDLFEDYREWRGSVSEETLDLDGTYDLIDEDMEDEE